MIKKRLVIFFALLFTVSGQRSTVNGIAADAGQPGSWLSWGVGTRSLGMGRAFTGVANDASAIYYNPAGITQSLYKQFIGNYAALYEATGYSFLGYLHPTVRRGHFGGGIVDLRTSGIDYRDSSGHQTEGDFSCSQTCGLFSYAYRVTNNFSLGTTLKIAHRKISTDHKTGEGLDLGVFWDPGAGRLIGGKGWLFEQLSHFTFGVNLQNLISPQLGKDKFPAGIRLGTAYRKGRQLLLAFDLAKLGNSGVEPLIGIEYTPLPLASFRAGLNKSEFNFGFGLRRKFLQLDYAGSYNYNFAGYPDLGFSHRIGIQVVIAEPSFKKEDLTRKEEKLYLKVEDYYRKGYFLLATKCCKEILQINPSHQGALDYKKKISNRIERIIQNHQYKSLGELSYAQAYQAYYSNNLAQAIVKWRQTLDLAPEYKAELAPYIKICEQELKKQEEQQKSRQRQREIEKYYNQGVTYYKRGELQKAVSQWEKVLRLDSQHKKAIQGLRKAKKILRKMEAEKIRQQQLLYKEKTAPPAEKPAQPEKVDKATVEKLYQEGLFEYMNGHLLKAKQIWEGVLQLDPTYAKARISLQKLEEELKQPE